MKKKWLFAGLVCNLACLSLYLFGLLDDGVIPSWIMLPKQVLFYTGFWSLVVVVMFYQYFSNKIGMAELTIVIVVCNVVAALTMWFLHDFNFSWARTVLLIGLFADMVAAVLVAPSCYFIGKTLPRTGNCDE